MGNTFKLSPDNALKEGRIQIAHAGEMRHLITELYNEIDELLKTGYTSPGAKVVYDKIQEKRPMLESLAKTFNNYGGFMINSGGKTINVDESIADGANFE